MSWKLSSRILGDALWSTFCVEEKPSTLVTNTPDCNIYFIKSTSQTDTSYLKTVHNLNMHIWQAVPKNMAASSPHPPYSPDLVPSHYHQVLLHGLYTREATDIQLHPMTWTRWHCIQQDMETPQYLHKGMAEAPTIIHNSSITTPRDTGCASSHFISSVLSSGIFYQLLHTTFPIGSPCQLPNLVFPYIIRLLVPSNLHCLDNHNDRCS
jgi:hypothetical protein